MYARYVVYYLNRSRGTLLPFGLLKPKAYRFRARETCIEMNRPGADLTQFIPSTLEDDDEAQEIEEEEERKANEAKDHSAGQDGIYDDILDQV